MNGTVSIDNRSQPMTKREFKARRKIERHESAQHGNNSSNLAKWIIIAVGSALFLAFFAYIIFSIKQSKNKPFVISNTGWVRGNPNAKTTLVEFSDFQCPACQRYEPLVEQVLKDFNGQMKLIYKHFPLTSVHKNAMLAAQASEAAGNQGKFWEMHDLLFEKHDEWAELDNSGAKEKFILYAESLKLDMERFKADLDKKETADKVTQSQNEGINNGVNATPTFFLNNNKIEPNPGSYEEFKKIISDAVSKDK